MGIRLIKWTAFSVIFGILPLLLKTCILKICGLNIEYNDICSEVIFFDLVLMVGTISEAISFVKYKVMQAVVMSFAILMVIFLVVMYTLLIMTTYDIIEMNFSIMKIPIILISIACFLISLSTQIIAEVEK